MRRWALPAIAGVVGVVAIVAASWWPSAPAPVAEAVEPQAVAPVEPPAVEPPPLPLAPSPAVAATPAQPSELPEAGRVHFAGQGDATVVPSDPATAPEAERAHPDPVLNPEIPPEQAQTPEWKVAKLDQATRMAETGIDRAERELAQATAEGDAVRIRRAETALKRRQALLDRVRSERARVQQELAGSTAP